ncbi:MAG: envelope stress response protein PspG [Aeromonas sp.]
MLEFFILLMVLLVMALTGFTLVAMLLVSSIFVLLGALGGMLSLIIELAPWLLLALFVCWLISHRRQRNNTYL